MPASATLSACRPTTSFCPIWSSVCALRVPAIPRRASTAITSRTRTSAMPSCLGGRRALSFGARGFIGNLPESVGERDLRAQSAGQTQTRQRVHLGRARGERDVVLLARGHRQRLEVRDALDGGLCTAPVMVIAEQLGGPRRDLEREHVHAIDRGAGGIGSSKTLVAGEQRESG